MMKLVFYIIFIIMFLLGCQQEPKKNKVKKGRIQIKKENLILDKQIQKLLDVYSKKYPLDRVRKSYIKPSYFLSFSQFQRDTILLLGKQPFLFEIFPDFAFSKKVLPSIKPKERGIMLYYNKPLIVYDIDSYLGRNFYKKDSLLSEIPKKFYINPEKFYISKVMPLWKYKIKGKKIIPIGQSDTLQMK